MAVASLVGIIGVIAGVTFYWIQVGSLNPIEHETSRWAVIEDSNRDRIAIEPTSDQVWSALVLLQQKGTRSLIGGIVERHGNRWGFRFKPDTVRIVEFTAEGLQATLKLISSDIDYWVNLGYAYVSAKVVDVHSPS